MTAPTAAIELPRTFEEFNEQYPYLLAVALVLLLVEFVLLDRRNPLLAHLNIFREKREQ